MKKKKAPPRARQTVVTEVRLVLVDEAPLRDTVMREHHHLEEQAAEVRVRIERFESADLPAYTRWEARVLGPLLTAIRDAEADLNKKRAILEAVEDEMFFSGCSKLAAYKRVMRQLNDPDPDDYDDFFADKEDPRAGGRTPEPGEEFGLPEGFSAEDFDAMSPERQRHFRMEYNFMAEMYEAVTGMPAPDLDELLRASRRGAREEARGGHHGEAPPPRSHARTPHQETREPGRDRALARVKELYRMLVRKLHPDLNPDQSPRDRELWHSVQEAYNRRDVEALEAAAARVEIRLNGQAGHLAVSLLHRLVSDLRKSLSALKTRLAGLRKHPAFDFAGRSPESLAKFEAKHRKELERNLGGIQSYLAELTAALDDLAERAAKPRKKRVKRVEVF